MKLNYSVNIDISELDFNGPKVPFDIRLKGDFYITEEYECFEEEVYKKLKVDIKTVLNQETLEHVCVECEADDQEDGFYSFGISFDLKGQLEFSSKNKNFKLSKSNINNLENFIIKKVTSKMKKFEKMYPDACINEIEVTDWELVD